MSSFRGWWRRSRPGWGAALPLPVRRQPRDHLGQDMAGQRRYAHSGQDQKTRVVGKPGPVGRPGRFCPTAVVVPGCALPDRGTQQQAGQKWSVASIGEMLQVSPTVRWKPR